jgi:acetyl-CoA carboxylase biotin carboxyl carrier protein
VKKKKTARVPQKKTATPVPAKAAVSPVIDANLVRELANVLAETGLTEIEIERGDMRLRLARTTTMAPVMTAPMAMQSHVVASAPMAPALAPPAPAPAAAAPAPAADAASHPGAVPSPMVGTAYLSAEPGAPAFIKVGDTVTQGQTLMVVEAMKTFNPIPAPRAGKITAILVGDAQPVEYGEPLVILE